jgi:hypothetical protein
MDAAARFNPCLQERPFGGADLVGMGMGQKGSRKGPQRMEHSIRMIPADAVIGDKPRAAPAIPIDQPPQEEVTATFPCRHADILRTEGTFHFHGIFRSATRTINIKVDMVSM